MSVKLSVNPAFKQTGQILNAAYKKLQAEQSAKFGIVLTGILIISAMAYLSLAFNWPKFSRAEVFFAECVREMFQADNLVTPLYHGTPFFDKPILAYWFIAASYAVFGISHFAARIPAVLLALGTVFLTALAGKNFFGAKTGAMAAAVLASSLMFISFANLCMSDMNLVFFDTLTLILLYASLIQEKRRSILLYLAALSMGLAFITKGPVGLVLPAVSFALYLSMTKQWHKIQVAGHVLPCALILAGAGVPWFMAAYRQNGGGALSYFFIHENLERFAGSTYDTHRPAWFMLVSLFGGMLPWSVFLPFALVNSIKESSQSENKGTSISFVSICLEKLRDNPIAQKHLFLWLWIAVVIGFFSLSRGKIDYYALPAYPAAAILIGLYLTKACDENRRPAIVLSWIASTALLVAGLVSAFVLPALFGQTNPGSCLPLTLTMIACGGAMSYFSFSRQLRKSFKMLFVAVCLLAIAFAFQVYPWITSKQAVLKYIPYIRNLPEDGRVGVYTSLQNWIDEITFQTDREPMKIETVKMAEQFLKAKSLSLLLIQENEFSQMSTDARGRCHVLASNPFIPRSLNPIYFITKREKLGAKTKLLLVSN